MKGGIIDQQTYNAHKLNSLLTNGHIKHTDTYINHTDAHKKHTDTQEAHTQT